MQFADAAGGEAHIDAGDLAGDREVRLGDLTSPAAILDAPRREVERGPELRQLPTSVVGGERKAGIGSARRGVVRTGDRQRPRVGDVDCALRGRSGLPNVAARASVAVIAAAPAAVAASTPRRDRFIDVSPEGKPPGQVHDGHFAGSPSIGRAGIRRHRSRSRALRRPAASGAF